MSDIRAIIQAKLSELRYGEVRRKPFPHTPVNKPFRASHPEIHRRLIAMCLPSGRELYTT